MSKPVTAIMQKEMTRQEFLVTLGFGIATVMGFSNLIRLLTGKSAESRLHPHTGLGYGSSPYGGGKE